MNVEELANGFVNAFSDMAKAASEFWEACNIVTDSIKKQVVSIQLAYIEKLTDKVNKACFLTRWYYTRKLYKEIGKSFNALDKWSYYIIASNENFESLFGKKANKKRKLYNGMIKCNLYQFFGERPPKTNK